MPLDAAGVAEFDPSELKPVTESQDFDPSELKSVATAPTAPAIVPQGPPAPTANGVVKAPPSYQIQPEGQPNDRPGQRGIVNVLNPQESKALEYKALGPPAGGGHKPGFLGAAGEALKALSTPPEMITGAANELANLLPGPFFAVHREVLRQAAGLASPVGLATIEGFPAALEIAAKIPGAAPALRTLFGGYFATEAGKTFLEASKERQNAWKKRDYTALADAFAKEGVAALTAGLGAKEAVTAVPTAASEALERHNLTAEQLVAQEAQRTTPVTGARGTPVAGTSRPMEVQPTEISPQGVTSRYRVVDPTTGDILHEGTPEAVQQFLNENQSPSLPGVQPGLSAGQEFNPQDLKPSAQTPSPHAEFEAGDLKPVENPSYELTTGTVRVTKTEGPHTYFVKTLPDGTVLKEQRILSKAFDRMVEGAAPTQEKSVNGQTVAPAEQAPASPEAEREVIQPNPTEAKPEEAGAEVSAKTADHISPESKADEMVTVYQEDGKPLATVSKSELEQLQAKQNPPAPAEDEPVADKSTLPESYVEKQNAKMRKEANAQPSEPVSGVDRGGSEVLPLQASVGAKVPEGDAGSVLPTVPKVDGDQAGKKKEAPVGQTLYRGVRKGEAQGEDKFYSADKETVEEFAAPEKLGGEHGTVEEIGRETLPENLYHAEGKESLAEELGLDPNDAYKPSFDPAVKKALRAQGYSGVVYSSGTHFGHTPGEEIHVFGKPSEKESQKEESSAHKYSSTQVNLPEEFASKAREAAAKIPDDVLAEDGREDTPHVTVLYGTHTTTPEPVQKLLEGVGPITGRVKTVSIFPANKGQESRGGAQYDVVKLDVDSPQLAELNKKLSALPNSNTFPKYQPHITLAYVKAGEGKKFVGRVIPGLSGKEITFDTATFSPAEGEVTHIPLKEKSTNGFSTSPKDAFRMKAPELAKLAKAGDKGAQEEIDRRAEKNGTKAPKVETKPAPAETVAPKGETKAPVVETKAPVRETPPKAVPGKAIAEMLRKGADSLQTQIDAKRNSGIFQQNPTRRRNEMGEGIIKSAERLERIQKGMRALADLHASGNVPAILSGVKSRSTFESLLPSYHEVGPERGTRREARFPSAYISSYPAKEIIEKIQGTKGNAEGKFIFLKAQRDGARITEKEIPFVEAAIDAAEKKGFNGKSLRESIATAKRLYNIGINEGNYKSAVDAVEALGVKKREPTAEEKIAKAERDLAIGSKIEGFFPTPKPLAKEMVQKADIRQGMTVLEPSAGNGNIADAIREEGTEPDVIEPYSTLRGILEQKKHNLIGSDFLEEKGKYDRIVMNPPFERRQDVDHVRHAYELLKPGGRVVAIMSEGTFFGSDKRAVGFREWLDEHNGTEEKLPEGSFTGKDAMRQAGVAARMVVIDKPQEKIRERTNEQSVNTEEPARESRIVPGFYSQLERTVTAKMPNKAPASQVLSIIRSPQNGVKEDEIKWSGLDDYLKEKGGQPVTKQEVLEFVRANEVKITEVTKSGDAAALKSAVRNAEQHVDIAMSAVRNAARASGMNQLDAENLPGKIASGRVDPESLPEDQREEARDLVRKVARLNDVRTSSGEAGEQAKYGQYVTPGGTNYRELLLTLPIDQNAAHAAKSARVKELTATRDDLQAQLDAYHAVERSPDARVEQLRREKAYAEKDELKRQLENTNRQIDMVMRQNPEKQAGYRSSHWDEPNVLAHIRIDDRTGTEGQKILHVSEIQSDWGQEIRRKGSKGDFERSLTTEERELRDLNAKTWGNSPQLTDAESKRAEELQRRVGVSLQEKASKFKGSSPDMPFAKSWPELSFKRVLRMAATEGYNSISWDTGETQADRYDLSKQISRVLWFTKGEKSGYLSPNGHTLEAFDTEGKKVLEEKNVPPEKLPDYIGKDAAQKLVDSKSQESGRGWFKTLEGEGLKTQAPGMVGFYDQILPAFANKYGKKWGSKVGTSELSYATHKNFVYEGDNHTLAEVEDLHRQSNAVGNNRVSPITGERLMFPFTRVTVSNQLKALVGKMRAGTPFKKAMAETVQDHGNNISDLFGGKISEEMGTESVKVHSMPITPEMRESVMQGQPLFMRGQEPETSGPIGTAYRNGILWVNSAGMKKLAEVFGSDAANGMYIPSGRASGLISKVPPELRPGITAALKAGPSITVVRMNPGESISQSKAKARHELFHATETWGGEGRAADLLEHPLAQRASALLAGGGYDAANQALMFSEIGAHLASGPIGWEAMGLTEDEAGELFGAYLDLLDEETLFKLNRVTPLLKKELNAERAIRREQTELGQSGSGEDDHAEEGQDEGAGGVQEGVSEDVQPGQGYGNTGKTKPSRLAERMTPGEGPEYEVMNRAEQIKQAKKILDEDPQRAIDIAMMRKHPPDPLTPQAFLVVVADYARETKNPQLLLDLSINSGQSERATKMGQEISMLAELDMDNPVVLIRKVAEARQEAVTKRMGAKAKENIKKSLKAQVKAARPKKDEWARFLETLKCP